MERMSQSKGQRVTSIVIIKNSTIARTATAMLSADWKLCQRYEEKAA